MPLYPDAQGFDHARQEAETLGFWDEHDVFAQSLAIREGAPPFVFYEGPPTANGKPGIHHVMSRTLKDLFCRYRTMKGYRVDRKAGWDTHGLPVEIEVEKELGLEGRHQVEAYGVAEYNAACRRSVLRYKDLWDDLTRRMGYWVDLSDPYVTFHNDYIESVWNLLKRISERRTEDDPPRSFLYRGHKIQWYSPGSGTVLSSHEVSLGYQEVQDPSVYVRFPVDGERDTHFLAWTTTPWTLPANAALAVGEGIEYVKVRVGREEREEKGAEFLILAKARLEVLDGEYEVVKEMTGADLVGREYESPCIIDREEVAQLWQQEIESWDAITRVFNIGRLNSPQWVAEQKANLMWRVVLADFVTTDDGTGVVHVAPAFGADDFEVGRKNDLWLFNPVESSGRFREGLPVVGGLWFKDADRPIIRDLRQRGLLFREDSYLHNYPHDWRKGTPLMSYPVESWFIRTTAIRDRMVELNRQVNWQPEGIGEGRFGQWLENNVDWAISRMRYWGTPLPIWVNDQDPDDVVVIGSVEELRERVGGDFPPEAINPETGELDLHRPFVDAITWPAPEEKGGATYRRVPDLLDVWFDSGAMPYAQWHYPFENREAAERNVPADFIAEGVDQTRGWFYTLHAIAALVRDDLAYRNVVVNGLVLDEQGAKMSKSVGNTVDPFETIQRHGADPVRWTMMSQSAPWESLRYSDRAVEETRRKLFGTVTNTYRFFATYANLDRFAYDAEAATPLPARAELDRWILSRLSTTTAAVDAALEAYHPTQAARAVETFVDDLSNWYLRRSRRRFWKGGGMGDGNREVGDSTDKQAAYETVYECLLALAKLMAPLAPFYAEWLFGNLTASSEDQPLSVHLTDFPAVDEAAVGEALEARMALARRVASVTLALRNEAGVNVRQPLGSLAVVVGVGGVEEDVLRSVEGIVLDEVNVKRLEAIPASSPLVSKTARPNFKALGRRLGKRMKAAKAAIEAMTPEQIAEYEQGGSVTLDLDGEPETFGPGDVELQSAGVEGRLVGQETADNVAVTVSLDPTLTDDLRREGAAREFVNRVQGLRKQAGFEVSDRIGVIFRAAGLVADAVEAHAESIRGETLAESLRAANGESAGGESVGGEAAGEFEIAGEPVEIGVRRAGP